MINISNEKTLKPFHSKEDGKDGVVWLYIYTVDFSTCFVLSKVYLTNALFLLSDK